MLFVACCNCLFVSARACSANVTVKQTTPWEKFLIIVVTRCGDEPIILDPAEERAESLAEKEASTLSVVSVKRAANSRFSQNYCQAFVCASFYRNLQLPMQNIVFLNSQCFSSFSHTPCFITSWKKFTLIAATNASLKSNVLLSWIIPLCGQRPGINSSHQSETCLSTYGIRTVVLKYSKKKKIPNPKLRSVVHDHLSFQEIR